MTTKPTEPDLVIEKPAMKIVDVAVGQKGNFTTVNRGGQILIHYNLPEGFQIFKVVGDETLAQEVNNYLADVYEEGRKRSETRRRAKRN